MMFASFRLWKKWIRWVTRATGLLFLCGFLTAVACSAPYMWARHLEARWHPAKPKTKVELESFLSLYSQRDIQPSESGLGRHHQLQAGERMTQYLLLWKWFTQVATRSLASIRPMSSLKQGTAAHIRSAGQYETRTG